MKTNKIILTGLIVLASAIFVLSCDTPVGLGAMLDTNGPAVTIESPAPRAAKKSTFTLEGTARDKSGIDKLVIKAEKDTVEYPKQWRYSKGKWEFSDNSGKDWQPYSGYDDTEAPEWNGNWWSIPIDMGIDSKDDDGEYLFSVQAWDSGNFTDDNSFKTIMLIIDNFAPSVEVSNPYLYSRYIQWNGSQFAARPNYDFAADAAELNGLHTNSTDAARFNSANIGKFLTQGFKLQWQIDDANDIWSIDLRFYKFDEVVDEDEGTFLNDNYIFSYKKNLPPRDPNTSSNINDLPGPNGSVTVPALHGAATGPVSVPDIYGGGTYELKNPLNQKTTVQVVSICYDAAGWASEEKILGYFIYWKEAGEPWIEYTSEMEAQKPDHYYGEVIEDIKDDVFMIYPGKDMKALAFQAHGVGGVEYSIYKCGENPITGKLIAPQKPTDAVEGMVGKEILNPRFSQIFSWSFAPPPMTGFYVVEAYAYGYKEVDNVKVIDKTIKSALYSALFRVQDLSFPKFDPIIPAASDPLFMHIYEKEGRSKIKIEGTVTDATRIENIYMVWINPQSKDYATMSQLEYYRDKDFKGWLQAAGHPKDGNAYEETITDETYDGSAPNKLWNIDPGEPIGVTGNQRQIFAFSVEIDLEDDLNIGLPSTLDDLKSQMFLLRAENPDKKCDIITYAPQGDTIAPTIAINTVTIKKTNGDIEECTPTHNIEQFENGDEITINGRWTENSTAYLDFDTYLKPNFEFSLNGVDLTHDPDRGIVIAYPPLPNGHATEGTFTITITLGDRINQGHLRDTLMVNMKVHDFGGNPAESGSSWLVKGDTLTFLRISSEDPDDTYIAGAKIELYLEFSKPVLLNPAKSALPVLRLNSTGTGAAATATYGRKDGSVQTVENTRQYFTYTVGTGHTTNALDVTGIQDADTDWAAGTYRFMWQHTADDSTEYVRLTGSAKPTGGANPPHTVLPTSGIQSLAAGKQISIDTTAPTFTSIAATQGRHREGTEVYITVTFSENVTITGIPRLSLTNGNGNTGQTSDNADDISVTRNTIRFKYTVRAGDTTGTNQLTVTGYTPAGSIKDIAGNSFGTIGNRTLTGVYLDTIPPDNPPQIRILDGSNNQINTNVSSSTRTGLSDTGAAAWDNNPPAGINLVNIYNDAVKIEITAKDNFNTDYDKLEYSTNNGKDWVQCTGITSANKTFTTTLSLNGLYHVTARQTDTAGNVSDWTLPISFNWDKGTLISRIDSTTPNGTYSNNTTTSSINVTIYFRKALNVSGAQSITLNVTRGGAAMPALTQTVTSNNASSLPFTYAIANNDNTPTGTGRTPYLNVTALSLQATDSDGVNVSTLLTLPTDTSLLLNQRKDIIVTTGALAPVTNPTQPVYAITAANDEATGTISITFNRPISKGSAGDITITQSTNGYRLPAVLTEAQYNRYRNVANFNDFYTRGTNGFSGSSPDTTTKYVLNYAETTVVTPSNAGGATDIQRMAYDFLEAEKVTLPVTSQDVTVVNENTLRINLTGTNALQVLGAAHTITIPVNCVQDTLGYRWPAADQDYTYTTPGINRPFIRVDKKVNQDRIDTATGSTNQPWLSANFTNVLQTRARLDCRTPNSVVRYNATGQRYDARGAGNTATGVTTTGTGTADTNWRNTEAAANQIDYQNQPTLAETGNTGTVYDNFGVHIDVGDNTQHGYVWRISTRSRNSTNGTTNSAIYEEIAFRTVLTVQITNMSDQYGIRPGSGDQLWIRGGDAPSSSSVPGFPLTWSDDWNSLAGKRAGIRLLDFISADTQFYTASEWKWITWEVNVETYYDILLGRHIGASNQPDTAATPGNINEPWQYGPRFWAYQRGGWAARKDDIRLYPGKHRWVCMQSASFSPGGVTNFSSSWISRPNLTPTLQAP